MRIARDRLTLWLRRACASTLDADAPTRTPWSDALLEAGALSVDLSDPAAGTADEAPLYGEPGDAAADSAGPGRASSALFAADTDCRCRARSAAAHALAQRHSRARDLCPSRSRTGCAQTQAQFGPIEIADGILDRADLVGRAASPDALNLRLDPGLAFGTGSHPTTRLCLEWLREHLARRRIACSTTAAAPASWRSPRAKLGAGRVVGTDVDPQAIRASEAQCARQRRRRATFVAARCASAGQLRHRRREHPRQSADRCSRRRSRCACAPAGASRCPAFSSRRRRRSPRRMRAGLQSAVARATDGYCSPVNGCGSGPAAGVNAVAANRSDAQRLGCGSGTRRRRVPDQRKSWPKNYTRAAPAARPSFASPSRSSRCATARCAAAIAARCSTAARS